MADINQGIADMAKEDPIVFGFLNKLRGETGSERKAREAREKAVSMAKDDLELKKQIAAQNNEAATGAAQEINGEASDAEILQILTMMQNGVSPEQISAQMGYGQQQGADLSYLGGKPAAAPVGSGAPVDRLQAAINSRGTATKPTEAPTSASGPFMSRNGKTVSSGAFGTRTKPAAQTYVDKGAVSTGVDTLGNTQPQAPQFRQEYDNYGSPVGPSAEQQSAAYYAANPAQYTTQGGGPDRVAADGASVTNERSMGDFSPEEIAKATALAGKGRWSQQGEYDKVLGAKKGIYETLKGRLDGIKDPEAAAAQKDLENKALRSDTTRGQQQFAMDKLKGLTDVRETAEEKFMREVARRDQENQMVSQRKAALGNLAARGQLGSGAELASMLGGQASTSSNRVLEEMKANANAQQRAISALGKYSDMSATLGGQDITEGAHANQTGQFNNQLNEQHNQFVTKTAQENNRAKERRAATTADAGNDIANTLERQTNNRVSTIGNNAALKIGTATGGANLITPASKAYADAYVSEAQREADEKAAKGGSFNIGNL